MIQVLNAGNDLSCSAVKSSGRLRENDAGMKAETERSRTWDMVGVITEVSGDVVEINRNRSGKRCIY